MATGGGGGFNFRLARAYVQLDVEMGSYLSGMARAEQRFTALAQRLSQIGARFASFSQAATHVNRLTTATANLRAQLAASATQAQRLAASLRGATLGPRTNTVASMLRGGGAGLASLTRGIGGALGQSARGLGAGIASALRGSAPLIRSMGTAFAAVAKGFGSLLSSTLRAAGSLARSLGAALSAPLRALSGSGGLLGSLGGGIGLGGLVGGLGAGGLAAFSIRSAAQMEDRLATFRRITGAGAGEAGDFGAKLQGMAQRMPVGLESLFGMASTGARMGIPQEQLASFVRDMGRFSVALEGSGIDVQDATERISRLSAVFGTGSGSIARFGSALVKLDQMSTASASDILDITTRIAPMARTLGLSANRTLALSALAREGGVSPEVAGTSLSQILSKMASRKSMPGFARLAGQSTRGFEATLRADPFEALMGVSRGVGRMDKIQAIQALESLHLSGARVTQTLLALSAVSGKAATFTRASADEWLRLAATEDAVNLKSKTLFASMTRVGNVLTVTASKIGSALLPVAKGALESIGELASDVGGWFDRNQATLAAWGERVARVMRLGGIAFSEFGTVAKLAGSYALESVQRLGTIAGRVGSDLARNVGLALKATFTLVSNWASAVVRLLGSVFRQAGPILAAHLSNAVADMMDAAPAAVKGVMIALNPALAVMPKARTPVPTLVPDISGFHPAAIGRGLPAAKEFGFRGILDNLPSRAAERIPLWGRLFAARATLDAQQRAAEAAENAGVANDRARGDFRGGLLSRLLGRAKPAVPNRIAARVARAHAARSARMARAHARHEASAAGRARRARGLEFGRNPLGALAGMTSRLTKLGDFAHSIAGKAPGASRADKRADHQQLADLIAKGVATSLGGDFLLKLAREIRASGALQ